MICCFANFHEKRSFNDLAHHLDNEIEYAITKGCTVFVSGNKYEEDKIFEQRVRNFAEKLEPSAIRYVGLSATDCELRELFSSIANWTINPYKEN